MGGLFPKKRRILKMEKKEKKKGVLTTEHADRKRADKEGGLVESTIAGRHSTRSKVGRKQETGRQRKKFIRCN